MTKKTLVLMLAVTALCLSACGKDKAVTPPVIIEETEKTSSDSKDLDTIPESMPIESTEDDTAFLDDTEDGTEFFYYTLDNTTCEISGFNSSAKKMVVPEIIDDFTVVGIRSYAFAECEAEEIVFPDTVEYISEAAFSHCPNLVSIDLGTGLKAVGDSAFNICPVLEKVIFPEGMTTIVGICFGFCDSLEEVYIPASTTDISDRIAFVELCPNIVIVTPAGSKAESVANENGLPVRIAD